MLSPTSHVTRFVSGGRFGGAVCRQDFGDLRDDGANALIMLLALRIHVYTYMGVSENRGHY